MIISPITIKSIIVFKHSPIEIWQTSTTRQFLNVMRTLTLAAILVAVNFALPSIADAGNPLAALRAKRAAAPVERPWHGGYYAQQYGQPTALVVPPGAAMRQTLSWGVSQNLMYPVDHQFGRSASYPGAAQPGSFRPTPVWPSHTDQFGYYYVRGPWR